MLIEGQQVRQWRRCAMLQDARMMTVGRMARTDVGVAARMQRGKENCSTATAIATITITITIIKTTPPASCTPPKPAHPNQLHYITYHHLNQLQYDSPSLFDSGPHDLQWRVEPVSHLKLGFRVFNRKVDRTCDNRKRVAYSVCGVIKYKCADCHVAIRNCCSHACPLQKL